MDDRTSAYFRERRVRSGGLALGRDILVGLAGAALGLFAPDGSTRAEQSLFAAAGAVVSIVLVECGLYVWRFVWAAPKQMHFDALRAIERIERERDEARANQFSRSAGQTGLSEEQCRHLAKAIHNYDRAINNAARQRFSRDARAELKTVFREVRDWLTENVGPVQGQSFESASPVAHIYSGVPASKAAHWQVSQGRLAYLRDLANRLCG
jgi:hypothetical protein